MPSISKIRFTNVVYEDGNKRYNDEIFVFDGHNGAILLENGGGKTVFIHTALQAILPHTDLAERRIKSTLKLDEAPAHIAIEWITDERPRRYVATVVSLFLTKDGLDSYRYVYEYAENDAHSIINLPFVKEDVHGKSRPAERGEIQEYYSYMSQNYSTRAKTFSTIKEFRSYIEENYQIIPNEWESIVKINSSEGGVEKFFEECKTTSQLFDRLLIPTIEDSIIGQKAEDFVETFEKHRSSFKTYKQLKEKIEENKKIKEELERYARVFEVLHQQQQQYQTVKQKAKAYAELNLQHLEENKLEQENIQAKLREWEEKDQQYKIKKASYEIAVEQEKQAKITEEKQRIHSEHEGVQQQHREKETQYYSLKLALAKKNHQEAEHTKKLYEEKLAKIDEELDIDEIKERVETNKQELKGYFIQQREKFEKQQSGLAIELQSHRMQVEALTEENELNLEKKHKLDSQLIKNEALFQEKEKEMQKIRKDILSQPDQEEVEDQLQIWINKQDALDQETTTWINQNRQLENEKQERKQKVEAAQSELQALHVKRSSVNTTMQQFETAHEQLKEKLAAIKYQWANLDSVYLKQDSIKQQLSETIHRLEKEREKLLTKERLSFRFVDDYAKQDVFYADPYLSQQIDNWKNQFSYLETGVKYIQLHGSGKQSQDQEHALWPTTLITTTGEKRKLIEKIKQLSKYIQFPVYVLTNDEARQILSTKNQNAAWISPDHWQQNMDQQTFELWKQSIQEQANESKKKRVEKEEELKIWESIIHQFQQFTERFSYNEYQEIKEEKGQLDQGIYQLDQSIKKIQEQITETERQIKINQDKIAENRDQINGLAQRIEKGNVYLQIQKKNQEINKENIFLKEEIRNYEKKALMLNRQLKMIQERMEDQNDQMTQVNIQIEVLKSHPFYSQVIHVPSPIFTEKSLENLQQEYEERKNELNRVSATRSEIETVIRNEEGKIKNFQQQIQDLRNEHEQLHEELEFPYNGQEVTNKLWEQTKTIKRQVETLDEKLKKIKEKEAIQIGKVTTLREQFLEKHPDEEMIQFTEPLELVKDQLNHEMNELTDQKEYLQKEENRNHKRFKEINEVRERFSQYEMRHQFMNPRIPKQALSPEEIMDYEYNRNKTAQERFEQLDQRLKQVVHEQENVNRSIVRFKDFCNNQVTDVKMREMSIKGIETKTTFDEVVEFKKHMENRIQYTTNLAEENIRYHDEQLQQYINHLLTWIRKIADELKVIPKKTKVKVDDQWKDIYQFNIPEWDDTEGKALIRDHIEWILTQLEQENFKDQDGNEKTAEIRKKIETWLQSKQLLRVVMKEKTMKVSLHKVSNNNQVSTRHYTWEQSNAWSGGEKWSKNMTLFLGMLNYIAEKRQHIKPKMKRHRTVIVDNPFGKASSEHVLNPVFFIAEQLGFQIIALTALAEGKFLRDYFPVIYSCKLRHAVGSEKQIMTKEKVLHHAYFQDHEPESMERLGEVEQMKLF